MPITWGVVSSSICGESALFVMEEVGKFLDQWSGHKIDIADVTNFVLPGSPLDEEASQRGTSVYMVERRIDMLPKPLTEGIIMTHFHKVEIKLSVEELCLQGLFKCVLTYCCFGTDICSLRAEVERLAFSVIWVCLFKKCTLFMCCGLCFIAADAICVGLCLL